ncbi:MAG: FtsH protease activity modulator HflK, partial [Duodenibacillus sp.]|nr:FtsH protease activity modulator HflK [Duodenibacillus sp.]
MLAAAALAWGATGFYIVKEGWIGAEQTFGRYTAQVGSGIHWHMPWPIQTVEHLDVSSVRKTEIGMTTRMTAQRLKEALMLTDDENIVDVQFNVQYRIKPARAAEFIFRSRNPDQSVQQAAESAMREVVGRKYMDSVLFESKQEIAADVKRIMQQMLDRYRTGIEVMQVAIQNAQPPEQVQAAFNDAVKAGQDRERQINEGEAYANAVIPKANGLAARLRQEAEGYKARVTDTARGDAERFEKVLAQYELAPRVTQERMYIDAMREV